MTVPVFREILEQNPDIQIVMVSRENFSPLFEDIERLSFRSVNLDNYKGFFGIRRLATELISEFQPDYVADLHDVIRTKLLDKIFIRRGLRVVKINKGKDEKEELTDIKNLDKVPLKHTAERYADVFRQMDCKVLLSHRYRSSHVPKFGIGFAPFAQHTGKVLPPEKTFELAKILSGIDKLYLFGGGKGEAEILKAWETRLQNTVNLAGRLSLKEELQKISELKVMVSMDSANMHLASLSGTRCISVWGSTHYFAGFLGYGQSLEDVVHVSDLTCRPCSVFGDRECYRGDYACLQELNISKIVEKIGKN